MRVEKFLIEQAEKQGGYVNIDGKKIKMIERMPSTLIPSSCDLRKSDDAIAARTSANEAMSIRSMQIAARASIR